LMLGDVEERVKILASVGQKGLAYILAKNHNLSNLMLDIAQTLEPEKNSKAR